MSLSFKSNLNVIDRLKLERQPKHHIEDISEYDFAFMYPLNGIHIERTLPLFEKISKLAKSSGLILISSFKAIMISSDYVYAYDVIISDYNGFTHQLAVSKDSDIAKYLSHLTITCGCDILIVESTSGRATYTYFDEKDIHDLKIETNDYNPQYFKFEL